MAGTFRVGRVFGVELNLHWSWLFIFALVTVSFAEGAIADAFPDWDATLRWPAGAVIAIIFFCCLLAHEMAHSVVANRLGIPVRSITLFIFGGSSNLEKDPDTARHEVLIAVVGPLTSFAVGVTFAAAYLVLDETGSGLAAVAGDLAFINIAIGFFNLIPGFPMDGGRLLRGLFWSQGRSVVDATRYATIVAEGVSVLFMAAGVGLLLFVDAFAGIWILLIGNFLRTSSVASYQQVFIDQVLSKVLASAVARRDVPTVAPATTLRSMVDDYFLAGGNRCLPVVSDGELLGLVTLVDIRKVQRDAWETTTAAQAMTPAAKLETVGPSDNLAAVMQLMAVHAVNQVPLVEGGRLLGLIERSDVIAQIETLTALADTTGKPTGKMLAAGGTR